MKMESIVPPLPATAAAAAHAAPVRRGRCAVSCAGWADWRATGAGAGT